MKDELIDVLNEDGIQTGEILSRAEVHKRGLWHRAIVVAIINEKNEILLQQRSDKTLFFQKEEVQAVKFVDILTIQKMIENNEIVQRPEVYNILTNFLFRF